MLKKIVIIGLVGCALVLAGLRYHVILMDHSIELLKKSELTFTDTWVDARGAKKYKLLFKPALVQAGFKKLVDNAR